MKTVMDRSVIATEAQGKQAVARFLNTARLKVHLPADADLPSWRQAPYFVGLVGEGAGAVLHVHGETNSDAMVITRDDTATQHSTWIAGLQERFQSADPNAVIYIADSDKARRVLARLGGETQHQVAAALGTLKKDARQIVGDASTKDIREQENEYKEFLFRHVSPKAQNMKYSNGRRYVFVLPNPPEQGSAFALQALTGLSPDNVHDNNARVAERMVLYHELGHAMDEHMGDFPRSPRSTWILGRHKDESRADAFAVFAMAKEDMNTDAATLWANVREREAHRTNLSSAFKHEELAKGLPYLTGNVIRAAQAQAEALLKSGKLQTMSDAEMAKLAATVTAEHSYDKETLQTLLRDYGEAAEGIPPKKLSPAYQAVVKAHDEAEEALGAYQPPATIAPVQISLETAKMVDGMLRNREGKGARIDMIGMADALTLAKEPLRTPGSQLGYEVQKFVDQRYLNKPQKGMERLAARAATRAALDGTVPLPVQNPPSAAGFALHSMASAAFGGAVIDALQANRQDDAKSLAKQMLAHQKTAEVVAKDLVARGEGQEAPAALRTAMQAAAGRHHDLWLDDIQQGFEAGGDKARLPKAALHATAKHSDLVDAVTAASGMADAVKQLNPELGARVLMPPERDRNAFGAEQLRADYVDYVASKLSTSRA